MFISTYRHQLSPSQRHQVRTLLVKDAIAMASIFAISVLLAIATYFLFQSYKTHRKELADRWFARGQKALSLDQPLVAIDDLHSALLYAPGQRQIEVTLASALASAGKIQEATAYFNTLWEAEPGNGQINVQLARLAARGGNQEQAKHYYHAAIYGNWEGDGYLKRRDTRLELVRYLISLGDFDQARSELLVAAGNAPAGDLQVQSVIAGLMLEDHAPADALAIYQQLLTHAPNDFEALDHAGQTAYSLGNYVLAHRYLQRAIGVAESQHPSAGQQQADEDLLRRVNRILVLDPSLNLPSAVLSARLLGDREIARKRFDACVASSMPEGTAANAASSADALPPALASVLEDWNAEPKRLTASELSSNTELQQKEIQLIEESERSTALVCGNPSGDDAVLLRLAQVPNTSTAAFHE